MTRHESLAEHFAQIAVLRAFESRKSHGGSRNLQRRIIRPNELKAIVQQAVAAALERNSEELGQKSQRWLQIYWPVISRYRFLTTTRLTYLSTFTYGEYS